jgi:N-acylneuraminate cytidylyltransferase/CMP-N,N'-diacetyllegionaminic acid synthase
MKKSLIVITARAGSKGIPNKNLVDVGGEPLIFYTLDVASRLFNQGIVNNVILSTDSEAIIDYARRFKNIICDLRPTNLAKDDSKSIDVLSELLIRFKANGKNWDYVVLLQPTSPLRTFEHVSQAIRIFVNLDPKSLISGYLDQDSIYNKLYEVDGNIGIPISLSHNSGLPRKLLSNHFVRNAAIYITSTDYLLKENKVVSDNPALFIMNKRESLDLNDLFDLEVLRCLISK